MDWDDLRYFLAIAKAGSLGGAARLLGVHHSSVYRRLEAVERHAGVRLFDRQRAGYRLTPQGDILADAAGRMEAELLSAERQVLGSDLKLSGTIRVSTSELLGLYFLPGAFREFIERFPEVKLDVSINNRLADLSRRDADVAIRGTYKPPQNLVGRRVAPMPYCAYAHRSLLGRDKQPRALERYDWIGFDEPVSKNPLAYWLHREVPGARCRLTYDSVAAVRESLAAGLGAAVLPCFVGDRVDNVVRIGKVQADPDFGMWVLTHRDLRRSARIRAFMRWMGDAIAASPYFKAPP